MTCSIWHHFENSSSSFQIIKIFPDFTSTINGCWVWTSTLQFVKSLWVCSWSRISAVRCNDFAIQRMNNILFWWLDYRGIRINKRATVSKEKRTREVSVGSDCQNESKKKNVNKIHRFVYVAIYRSLPGWWAESRRISLVLIYHPIFGCGAFQSDSEFTQQPAGEPAPANVRNEFSRFLDAYFGYARKLGEDLKTSKHFFFSVTTIPPALIRLGNKKANLELAFQYRSNFFYSRLSEK